MIFQLSPDQPSNSAGNEREQGHRDAHVEEWTDRVRTWDIQVLRRVQHFGIAKSAKKKGGDCYCHPLRSPAWHNGDKDPTYQGGEAHKRCRQRSQENCQCVHVFVHQLTFITIARNVAARIEKGCAGIASPLDRRTHQPRNNAAFPMVGGGGRPSGLPFAYERFANLPFPGHPMQAGRRGFRTHRRLQ